MSTMPSRRPGEWVLLAYRLPREPSTPRIALWRRLRRLGAAQLLDGLVGLPFDAKTREQLEWVAEDVTERGGDASIWIARPSTVAEERALASRMRAAIAADYRAVVDAARSAAGSDPVAKRRTLRRLRETLRAIEARDYFPPPERDEARAEVALLAEHVEVPG
jgi:hypothetical protein